MAETVVRVVPRIHVARARDVPKGAVRVFGAVLWRNPYSFRTRNGLARVPAAQGAGEWEYEDRISAAGEDGEMAIFRELETEEDWFNLVCALLNMSEGIVKAARDGLEEEYVAHVLREAMVDEVAGG